jgi:hypothetical protein
MSDLTFQDFLNVSFADTQGEGPLYQKLMEQDATDRDLQRPAPEPAATAGD